MRVTAVGLIGIMLVVASVGVQGQGDEDTAQLAEFMQEIGIEDTQLAVFLQRIGIEDAGQLAEFMQGIGITPSGDSLTFVPALATVILGGVAVVCLTEPEKCPVSVEAVQEWFACVRPRTVTLPTSEGDETVRADHVNSVGAAPGNTTDVGLPGRTLSVAMPESAVREMLGACWSG